MRLSLAFAQGMIPPPQGRVVIFHPPQDFDLAGLDPAQCDVVHPHKVAYDHWQARGAQVFTDISGLLPAYDLAIICATRVKGQTRDLIARACDLAPLIVVDGQKTDGIDSHFKAVKKHAQVGESITKSHGRLFVFNACPLPDWKAEPQMVDGFQTRTGVFSADGIDPASRALAVVLPDDLRGHVADFGAGWGYLSAQVLKCPKVTQLDLVEADHTALECARHNITDPRAQLIWADATRHVGRYNTIVMNPPFHQGRKGEPTLGIDFIRNAAKCLTGNGQLWVVANRHLPYEVTLSQCFAKVHEQAGTGAFKVYCCSAKR